MITFERVKGLADKQKISIVELEEKLGFSRNSLYSWKKNKPSIDKLNAVADYFGVTTDYLLGRADTPEFTTKDEKDVQRILEDLINGLSNENSLAFLKNGGVEIDEEDAELLRDSLERTVRRSKILAKEKFTPKKYRKMINQSEV
uniref:Repressor protein n=1 Tax=Siphoviridae sp. ctamP19 TaxID=2827896 RepID=A0A8S5TNA1_9CAUD|nr:MAG TPA: repressor protein [Siphoviridae sp. ctamP19]